MTDRQNVDLLFIEFLLATLDEHAEERPASTPSAVTSGSDFYASLYADWRQRDAQPANVVAFRRADMSKSDLMRRSIMHVPIAAAAASGDVNSRRLTDSEGRTLGRIDCIDSADGSSFYVVFRFEREIGWNRASLVLLSPKGDSSHTASLELGDKSSRDMSHQILLDLESNRAVYDALHSPLAEAYVVEA